MCPTVLLQAYTKLLQQGLLADIRCRSFFKMKAISSDIFKLTESVEK